MEAEGGCRLLDVLEENLYDLATRLPRLMRGAGQSGSLIREAVLPTFVGFPTF